MSVPDMRGDGVKTSSRRSRLLQDKKTWAAVGSAAVLGLGLNMPTVSYADLAGGCDFAPTGTTASCLNPLTGSTFAGGDGNLLTSPTTYGTTDWQNVGGLNTGVDLASGSGDNAFGQGTKEDSANVSVVTGSIPPQKSDLTRFYEASEFANGSNFLYLAWERTNNLGSANMDFEINQKTQPDLTTTGSKTLNRTAGDLLVTFDFTNGGGRPTIGLLRWVTSGSTSQCFSSNSLPCWGNEKTLDGTDSIGAVNNLDAVTDPFLSGTNNVGANRFGETAINLTAAGVFPSGTCVAFGSAFLKSRSSASFPAEVKDFVAPIPVNISNCGEVTIVKHTDPAGIDQDFSYDSDVTGTVAALSTSAACPTGSNAFKLNDAKTDTIDCFNVPTGSYTVVEHQVADYVLKSLTCDDSGSTQDATDPLQADISVTPNLHVTCTYVNKLQLGAIKITKTGKNKAAGSGDQPLAGAKFSITGPNNYSSTATTGSDGTVCVDSLPFGDYTVTETSAPSGYQIDDATGKTVTVDTNATCTDATYVGGAQSFTDTPLTDIAASATAQSEGATNSTIVCKDANDKTVGDSGPNGDPANASAKDLVPGTYTCTIVIDP